MAEKENPAKPFGAPDGNNDAGYSGSRLSCTTIERINVGDREVERTTFQCGDFLECSFVNHQPDAIENNSNRFSFKVTTPGGQPCEVDGREVDAVKFTIVGNFELAAFLSGVAELARWRRNTK